MRIQLNLSTSVSLRDRYALAWALPLTVLGLAGLLFFSLAAVRKFREYRSLHRSVLELESREDSLRKREATLRRELEQPQFRELSRQIEFVNGLIEKKQFSLTELTAKTTKLLPDRTRLTALGLSREGTEPVVRFTVVGRDEEAVEDFLRSLENSPDFRDVALLNQGFEAPGGGGEGVVITCTARYMGGLKR